MKKKIVLLTLCFWCLAMQVFSQAPDTNFHLYILIGQSNMAGRGQITRKLKKEHHDRVWMFTKDLKWVVAKHPLHFDKPQIAAVGPGLSFGIQMANAYPHAKIGLIPCAVGGTPIEHWQPGAYDEATKTHPWDDAAARIREAMKYGVVKGAIWHQGEANSRPENMNHYLAQLTELINRLRILVNNPNLPFIAGELGRYRAAYANINIELAKLPSQVPFTSVASSKKLIHKGDTIHFTGPSAEKLGKRFATQMLNIQRLNKID